MCGICRLERAGPSFLFLLCFPFLGVSSAAAAAAALRILHSCALVLWHSLPPSSFCAPVIRAYLERHSLRPTQPTALPTHARTHIPLALPPHNPCSTHQTFTQFEFESFPTQMKIELFCLILMLACHELADALAAPLGDSDCRKGLKWCRQALVVAPLENVGNTSEVGSK